MNHLSNDRLAKSFRAVEVQRPTRRAFLIGAAGFTGAVLFSLRHPATALAFARADGGKAGQVTIAQFSPDGKLTGKVKLDRVVKSDEEWKSQLSPISYQVTRHAGTERAYTGSTWDLHDKGIFHCVCCDIALFSSETKFDSGTGWPSFWQPIARENISDAGDNSLGMARTAVSCALCDAHLGHVFDDGPKPTGLRYCMNSAAMRFAKLA